MNTFSHVPPGFRFHPTDEELVDYYLRKKINGRRIDLDVIKDVDLYKIEPWDLKELCRIIGSEEENEWYFFSHKDKKYPTGTRTNRATNAGFWKATGRDKSIYSSSSSNKGNDHLIGMRKTLVFYKGRAPNGLKSDWIMHEYRLETDQTGTTTQEEGWVVCRVFKKKITTFRRVSEQQESSSSWPYDHHDHDHDHPLSFINNNNEHHHSPNDQNHISSYNNSYKLKDLNFHYNHHHQFPQNNNNNHSFLHLPLLNHDKTSKQTSISPYGFDINQTSTTLHESSNNEEEEEEEEEEDHELKVLHDDEKVVMSTTTDWRVLDKFVASQLSQEDSLPKLHTDHLENIASASATHEIELWKS